MCAWIDPQYFRIQLNSGGIVCASTAEVSKNARNEWRKNRRWSISAKRMSVPPTNIWFVLLSFE